LVAPEEELVEPEPDELELVELLEELEVLLVPDELELELELEEVGVCDVPDELEELDAPDELPELLLAPPAIRRGSLLELHLPPLHDHQAPALFSW
jgi:hypothetical protein